MMVRQNKWRAARYGNKARMVHARHYRVQSVTEIVADLIDKLRDVAVDLGCESELLYVNEIARGDGWADRQRQILDETKDPSQIVSQLAAQSRISDNGATP